MLKFTANAILLVIEGTTSSIQYVHNVLFPYARKELKSYLRAHWTDPELARIRELMARDAGTPDAGAWLAELSPDQAQEKVAAEVSRLMNADAKATGLKALQGAIWDAGFKSGVLRAHVYADVPEALQHWQAAGLDVRIYSSGSIAAQKLFFANTEKGDLSPYLRGHYDTTSGPKKASGSYLRIAAHMQRPVNEILFLSDIVAELDAARTAGMQTALSVRPENPSSPANSHPHFTSFTELEITPLH